MKTKAKSSRKVRAITALSIGVILVSAFSWISLDQITGSLKKVDVFSQLKTRPVKASTAVNYLLVGSDTREGLTQAELKALRVGSVATAAGKRSDTMLLVHISKARDKATIISIPRDTLVTIPERVGSNGKIIPATKAKLNAAFNWGDAQLLIQVLESLTNLRIDHYIEINFAGFAHMVDALGGIQVCTKTNINDPNSHLILSAGVHTLQGIDALKYVRTRDFDGMGDLGRMQRQQQFMSSVIRKATSTGVLLNPIKMVKFLNAAMATVQTDSTLTSGDLLDLAKQLKNLSSSKVRTLTVPLSDVNHFEPGIGSTVIWDPILSADLWLRLRKDMALVDIVTPTPTPVASASGATAQTSASPTSSPASSPASSSTSTKKPSPKAIIVDKFKTRTAAENPCGALK